MLYNKLPLLSRARVKGKRVLVRVDFNVPLKGGRVLDDFRIQKTLPTIQWLFRHGATPVLVTHLEPVRSIRPIKLHTEKLLGRPLEFLENVRFHKGEKTNSPRFAKRLSRFGDIYVNDAFGVSHRRHASIVAITKFLPSYAGLLFAEEIKKLEETLSPRHPFLFILGGLKLKTKVSVLERFLKKADTIFICGAIANSFLRAKGYRTGRAVIERNMLGTIRKKFLKKKILLPVDVVVGGKTARGVDMVRSSDNILDAGPKTVEMLKNEIKKARMILWNGPLGDLEDGYTKGTEALIRALANARAKVIVGGGDTHIMIKKMKKERSFYHLSTGGGAMLEFLEDGEMPGLKTLLNSKAARSAK